MTQRDSSTHPKTHTRKWTEQHFDKHRGTPEDVVCKRRTRTEGEVDGHFTLSCTSKKDREECPVTLHQSQRQPHPSCAPRWADSQQLEQKAEGKEHPLLSTSFCCMSFFIQKCPSHQVWFGNSYRESHRLHSLALWVCVKGGRRRERSWKRIRNEVWQ